MNAIRLGWSLSVLLPLALAHAACSDSDDTGPGSGDAGSGGRSSSGGASSSGGKPSGSGGGSTDAGSDATPSPAEAGSGDASPADSGPAEGGAESAMLVVADAKAGRMYVYAVPGGELRADLKNVTFADHPGFVTLGDGRVLFTDSLTEQLVVLRVFGAAEPHVERRIALGGAPVHLAVSGDHHWAAVSAAGETADAPGRFTLVHLDDYSSKIVGIPTGEPGVLLSADGEFLYHRNDDPAQIEAYAVPELWQGVATPAATRAIGPFPHGEAIAHVAGKIFVAADDGFNVVSASGSEIGAARAIPYAASSRTGGRAYYARLSADGRFLYSYLRDSGPNFDWPWRDWTNDAYIVDVEAETAKRLEVGNGLVYRLADSRKFALFAQYHPDGDFAFLLDADAGSSTFQTFVAKIPLEALSKMPTGPDADPWTSVASRITGMLPSGSLGFVTHGGDGKISVIDTETRAVTGTIQTPTPLDNGGYLLGVEQGSTSVDTVGR